MRQPGQSGARARVGVGGGSGGRGCLRSDAPSFLISIALPPLALRHEKPVGPMVRRPCDCGVGGGWGGCVWRAGETAFKRGTSRTGREKRGATSSRARHGDRAGAREAVRRRQLSALPSRCSSLAVSPGDADQRGAGAARARANQRESRCALNELTTPPRPPIEMLLKLCVPPSTAAMVATDGARASAVPRERVRRAGSKEGHTRGVLF